MHRSEPYPAPRPRALPPGAAEPRVPDHKFLYIHPSYTVPVALYTTSVVALGVVTGDILWNDKVVPCVWSYDLGGGQLHLRFHWDGVEHMARPCTYQLVLSFDVLRVWRSPQFGGQYLVQYPVQ